jgi:hypothetical protein
MDQKPIVLYLRMKGMTLDAIHDDLVCTLGKDAVAYSTVTKDTRSAQFSRRKEAIPPEAQMWNAVLSMRQCSRLLPNFRFRFRLCASFRGVSVFRDPSAPHAITSIHGVISSMGPSLLTAEQKQIRVQMAIKLLQVLSVQSTRQSHDIVTLEESWIYLFSDHDLMWTAPGEIVVDMQRHTVQSPKFTLTVVWNPIGFHVLKALPNGRKFNVQYYTNDILVAISDWRRQTGGTRPNKLWLHSDNARSHTAKMSRGYIGLNRMKQAPQPPIRQIWQPRTFSFWLCHRKADGRSR